jgi:hypothetical protein
LIKYLFSTNVGSYIMAEDLDDQPNAFAWAGQGDILLATQKDDLYIGQYQADTLSLASQILG